jgi:hypothetical protein
MTWRSRRHRQSSSFPRYSSAIDVGDRARDGTLNAPQSPELNDIMHTCRTTAHLFGSPPDPGVQDTNIRGIVQIEIVEGHHP